MLIEKLGKKWYFLTPDYAYGHSVQAALEKVLRANGGTSAGPRACSFAAADAVVNRPDALVPFKTLAAPSLLSSVSSGARGRSLR